MLRADARASIRRCRAGDAAGWRGAAREPLLFPATRWPLGRGHGGGFAFDNEKPRPRDRAARVRDRCAGRRAGRSTASSSRTAATTSRALERRRLGLAAARGAAHAAPRRPDAPGRAAAPLRPARARADEPAGDACHLVRGRRLVPLGRPPPAERGRMGSRRAPGRDARLPLGRRLGVDGHHLPAVPGLRGRPVPRLFGSPGSAPTRCCAAPPSPPRARMRHPNSATSTGPSATTCSAGFGVARPETLERFGTAPATGLRRFRSGNAYSLHRRKPASVAAPSGGKRSARNEQRGQAGVPSHGSLRRPRTDRSRGSSCSRRALGLERAGWPGRSE